MLFEVKKMGLRRIKIESRNEYLAVLRCRFDERLKEREEHLAKIAALEAVSFVDNDEFQQLRTQLLRMFRSLVSILDEELVKFRKELGIETSTSNEGTL